MADLMNKLLTAQSKIKAPKGQFNKFGGYKYRSVEDIQEAAKPILAEVGLTLTVSDSVELVGDRYYVRSTATVSDGTDSHSVSAYAREDRERKGMSESQVTGTASSYARKYALGGLFLLDDTKDDDANEPAPQSKTKPAAKPAGPPATPQKPAITPEAKAKGKEFAGVLRAWCDRHDADYASISAGVKQRPDFEQTVAYYNKLIHEFTAELKEK